MSWIFNGLPLHVLLVHFVVVVVPLAALVVVLSAVWSKARYRLGILTPIIALGALVAVPLTTQAGEALERQVGHTELIEAHTELGDTLLPWAIAVFVLAVVQWIWFRFVSNASPRVAVARPVRRALTTLLAVLVIGAAVGSVVTVVLIGESGSRAVWSGELDAGN